MRRSVVVAVNFLIGVLFVALALSEAAQSAGGANPGLSGPWRLNTELSDAPGGGPAAAPGRGPGGGGRGPGGIGRGGGPGRGGMADPAARERMRARMQLMRELMEPPPRFTLTVGDSEVSMVEPDGVVRRYRTDGRQEKHQFTNGTVETKTRWQGVELITDIDLGDGGTLTRTYALTEEVRQLVVTTRAESGRMPGSRAVRRVYDPEEQ